MPNPLSRIPATTGARDRSKAHTLSKPASRNSSAQSRPSGIPSKSSSFGTPRPASRIRRANTFSFAFTLSA